MKSTFAVEVQHLSIGYHGANSLNPVIDNCTFRVESGQTFCIIGSNGSGKTTLLNAIAGMLPPQSGSAGIVSISDSSSIRPPIIGLLHQDYRQTNLPWATVLENVSFPLRFSGRDATYRVDASRMLLQQLLPEVNPMSRVFELSGGQQQIVAIARALVAQVDVLLGDEPLSAADSVRALRTISAIGSSRKAKPFLMVWISHDVDEALLLGDRIALLSRSRKGFLEILDNPIVGSRTSKDLGAPEIVSLRTKILDFLIADSSSKLNSILS